MLWENSKILFKWLRILVKINENKAFPNRYAHFR